MTTIGVAAFAPPRAAHPIRVRLHVGPPGSAAARAGGSLREWAPAYDTEPRPPLARRRARGADENPSGSALPTSSTERVGLPCPPRTSRVGARTVRPYPRRSVMAELYGRPWVSTTMDRASRPPARQLRCTAPSSVTLGWPFGSDGARHRGHRGRLGTSDEVVGATSLRERPGGSRCRGARSGYRTRPLRRPAPSHPAASRPSTPCSGEGG